MTKILTLLGFGLSNLGTLMMMIKNFPLVWKLFNHREQIKKMASEMVWIFQNMRANGGLPSCEDSKKIVGHVEWVFKNQFIDLPGLDEMTFADQVRELNAMIICRVEKESGGPK